MSEDTNVPEGQEPEHQIDPVEEQARAQGWVPEDEYTGNGKWRPAQEFVDRGELFGKIESQNKELKSIRETLAQFKDHHNRVSEAAYKKAYEDLKAKKEEALNEGDAKLVIAVDEQLAEVREQQRAQRTQPNVPVEQEQHPEFVAFKNKNSWYESNKAMRGWADGRGAELAESGKSPSEVLNIIAREVREEFKSKFENPNRSKPGAVETSTLRGGKTPGSDYIPNATEKMLAQKFVKQGLFKSEAEYYADLKAMNS
jgi:hypothetical protein